MKEKELKVIEIDLNEVLNSLANNESAKKIKDEIFEAIYYDRNKELKNKGMVFRIRREGAKVICALKERVIENNFVFHNEYEIEVDSFDTFNTIVEKLGYEKIVHQKKRRISYIYKNCEIDIDVYQDYYSFIPPLLEVEGESEAEIRNVIKELGFDKYKVVNWNFFELVKYYGKEIK